MFVTMIKTICQVNIFVAIDYDAFVKSRKIPLFVIPEEAGIHLYQMVTACLDFVFHRSEDFLRIHQTF